MIFEAMCDKDAEKQAAENTDATKALDERLAELKKEEASVRASVRRTMITVALETPRTTRLLPRGNWLDDSGEILQPAIPEFLGQIDSAGRRATGGRPNRGPPPGTGSTPGQRRSPD